MWTRKKKQDNEATTFKSNAKNKMKVINMQLIGSCIIV